MNMIMITSATVNATPALQCHRHWRAYRDSHNAVALCIPPGALLSQHFQSNYFLPQAWSVLVTAKDRSSEQHQLLRIGLIDVNTGQHKLPPTQSYVSQYLRKHRLHPTSFYAFSAAVRVGMSAVPEDVRHCYHPLSGKYLKQQKINNTLFRVYQRQEAGMSQSLQAISYRYRTRQRCYAIEYLETGAGLADALGNTKMISRYYTRLGAVIINSVHIF